MKEVYLIKELSRCLIKTYGGGFSIPTLKNARQFYLAYLNHFPIGYAVRSLLGENLNLNLAWIHYLPSEEELKKELQKEMDQIQMQ